MKFWAKIKKPPWRTFILLFLLLGIIVAFYSFWSPGKVVTDGRHDLYKNGIWIQHGWLGHDLWFKQNRRDPNQFRNINAINTLAKTLAEHNIVDVFPHLCPCNLNGRIALVDDEQVVLFLQEMHAFRILPWIGGVLGVQVDLESKKWRKNFVKSTVDLLERHPKLAGIHINIEPLPSGNLDFLTLLDDLKLSLPSDKILSVDAYPLQPFGIASLRCIGIKIIITR